MTLSNAITENFTTPFKIIQNSPVIKPRLKGLAFESSQGDTGRLSDMQVAGYDHL